LTSTPTGTGIPLGYNCSNARTPVGGANSAPFQARQNWIWYNFTAPTDGTLVLDNCGTSPVDTSKVYVLSSCQFNDRNILVEGDACGPKTS
jgi:hypothetical protein